MSLKTIVIFLNLVGFATLVFFACNQEDKKVVTKDQKPKSIEFADPQTCLPCHTETVNSFLKTGKGRSFYPVSKSNFIENWKSDPVYDKILDLYYQPKKTGMDVSILEFRLENGDTIHKRMEKIDFVIGSGNQTRTYLFERNGYLFEIPLTWYTRKAIWDLSPGYENGSNNRFEREVGEECLYCHNSDVEAIPYSSNRYKKFGNAIGCEKCHGEVGTHLEEMKRTNGKSKDLKIISLGKLPLQAQIDVCRQCHLEGVKVKKANGPSGEYSPGKVFSDFFEVFIPASGKNDFGFASHSERLQLSKCFIESAGKMNCNTCHNPHSEISDKEKVEFFSQKCRTCHGNEAHELACSDLKNKKKNPKTSNCISCHMKKDGTNDIPHVNSTDHWIRRKFDKISEGNEGQMTFKNFAGNSYLKADLGMALLQYAETRTDSQKIKEVKQYLSVLTSENQLKYYYLSGEKWQNKLDTSQFRVSSNPWTWFYWAQLKKQNAMPFLTDLKHSVDLAPDMIEFQYKLVMAENKPTQTEKDYASVLRLNPKHIKSLSNLGFYALQKQEYPKAENLFLKALEQDPDFKLANENLVRCYLEQGKFEKAKQILKRLIKRNPLEKRYEQILLSMP